VKTTFRPTDKQQEGLEKIMTASGKNQATVLGWAVDTFIDYFNTSGGKELLIRFGDGAAKFLPTRVLYSEKRAPKSRGKKARAG
jgi:hypothetical protein